MQCHLLDKKLNYDKICIDSYSHCGIAVSPLMSLFPCRPLRVLSISITNSPQKKLSLKCLVQKELNTFKCYLNINNSNKLMSRCLLESAPPKSHPGPSAWSSHGHSCLSSLARGLVPARGPTCARVLGQVGESQLETWLCSGHCRRASRSALTLPSISPSKCCTFSCKM